MPQVSDYTSLLRSSWTTTLGESVVATPAIITYSFPEAPPASYNVVLGPNNGFQPFSAHERDIARIALNKWASISGITFIEAPGPEGDIKLSWLDFSHVLNDEAFYAPYGGFANLGGVVYQGSIVTFYRDDGILLADSQEQSLRNYGIYDDIGGDVFLNRNFEPSNDTELTELLMHEVGHSLGLKHPDQIFEGADLTLVPSLNTRGNSVMSLDGEPIDTLGRFDVQAVQYLYGTPDKDASNLSSWSYDSSSHTLKLVGPGTADRIHGTAGKDIIDGGSGDDVIFAAEGNDIIIGGPGRDSVSGGFGVDTYVLQAPLAQRNHLISQGPFFSWDAPEGREWIIDVERFQFTDGLLAMDADGNAGQAYRMYQAAFARTPDKDGVSFWVNQVDSGMSLQTMAHAFIGSAEFKMIYGLDPTVEKLITAFYTNVLGRAPDATGLGYWATQVKNGMSRDDLLVSFSESAENKAHVAPAIQNGIELSLAYFA